MGSALAPHTMSVEELGRSLSTDARWGLRQEGVAARLESDGLNELAAPHGDSLVTRIWKSSTEPMAVLLLVAAAVSGFALRETLEAIAIALVVALNTAISILQETRAEAALEALRRMETSTARVIRAGKTALVPAAWIAVGDLVLLAEGDRVPADVRLTVTDSFSVDESALTGESLPSTKHAEPIEDLDIPIADRVNCAFSGTLVVHGSGSGLVFATGPKTQIGQIAATLSAARPSTPLQRELHRLTRALAVVALVAGTAAFALSLFRSARFDPEELFVGAVALAVAAVPEGLATVVTVALAVGVSKMATEGAIIRHLPAVETLGATTVIATDKTGTLTMNKLTVRDEWFPDDQHPCIKIVAAVCNDAQLAPDSGDPLDVALLRWVGADTALRIRRAWRVIARQPFDSVRRYMEVLCTREDATLRLVKGAPEAVLDLCLPDNEKRRDIDEALRRMAERGLKVVAFASGGVGVSLSFVGLIGLGDPLRAEASATVRRAHTAGVRVIMVTGDHPVTAGAIATEAGIEPGRVILGNELDDRSLDLSMVSVLARTTPSQKLKLVQRLQREGEVVAVTGDGVNDAPALHRSDVGVAMGLSGTEVAKEAADIVVTDDNLATIVTAIREGRGIYANLRRVVHYLIAANLSEVIVVLSCLAAFPQLGVPLFPLQLLWVNLLTDALPAIGLGLDAPSENALLSPPRRSTERLLGIRSFGPMALAGALLAGGALSALAVSRFAWGEPWDRARTTLFLTLVFSQLAYVIVVRATSDYSARPGNSLWRNRWLVAGIGGGAMLQLGMMALEPARDLLGVVPLALRDWVLVAAAGILPCAAVAIVGSMTSNQTPTRMRSRVGIATPSSGSVCH